MTIDQAERIISVDSIYCLAPRIAGNTAAPSTSPWPTANKAIFIGFEVWSDFRFDRVMIINGTLTGANVDAGIYDKDGNRIRSTGSTAQAGAEQPQIITVPAATLTPGFYYFALALDSTSGGVMRFPCSAGGLGHPNSIFEKMSAFPLSAIVTWVPKTEGYLPWIGIIREGW